MRCCGGRRPEPATYYLSQPVRPFGLSPTRTVTFQSPPDTGTFHQVQELGEMPQDKGKRTRNYHPKKIPDFPCVMNEEKNGSMRNSPE